MNALRFVKSTRLLISKLNSFMGRRTLADCSYGPSCKTTSEKKNDIVKLNVGGVKFTTTLDTLRRIPNANLVRQIEKSFDAIKDDHELFIDRDGKYFHYVLDYLRNGDQAALPDLPDGSFKSELLFHEIDFYQLTGYQTLIKRGGVFKPGKTVALASSDAALYVQSLVCRSPYALFGLLGTANYNCWICQKSVKSTWPRKVRDDLVCDRSNRRDDAVKLLSGKIVTIEDDCAAVDFSWSLLHTIYSNKWGLFFVRPRIWYDCVVKLHVPLVYLKIKR